jgi:hypothetical protein
MSVLKIASTAVCAVFFAMILKNAGSQLYVLVTMAVSVLIIIVHKNCRTVNPYSYFRKLTKSVFPRHHNFRLYNPL